MPARTRGQNPLGDGRSHFGALAVAFHNDETKPRIVDVPINFLLEGPAPKTSEELARFYASRLREAIQAWRDGSITPSQVAYLDAFVRLDLLPASLGASERLDALVQEYRRLEDEVPIYRRAPSVLDEEGLDQRLLVRGSHKDLGDPVPRRYLEALDSEPYGDPATTRLQLAEEIADARNPLTARVLVNRVWAHLFGRGLVATVDNFGRVGSAPSHPGLLDYLADRFIQEGWSIKQLIRRLVLTSTYQATSVPSQAAASTDPENTLLQHMPVRRLEGEVIRDSLLAISGRFDPRALGPSINVYYAFAKGKTKGDRVKGPLDGYGRRSVYQEIRRNAHNPFLEVFDQPKPSSTRGTRDATNVPAQSLTMLNSPLVNSQAQHWGQRLAASAEPASMTVESMFLNSLGAATRSAGTGPQPRLPRRQCRRSRVGRSRALDLQSQGIPLRPLASLRCRTNPTWHDCPWKAGRRTTADSGSWRLGFRSGPDTAGQAWGAPRQGCMVDPRRQAALRGIPCRWRG